MSTSALQSRLIQLESQLAQLTTDNDDLSKQIQVKELRIKHLQALSTQNKMHLQRITGWVPKQIEFGRNTVCIGIIVSMRFLSLEDISNASKVSKPWNAVATNPQLYIEKWTTLIAKKDPNLYVQHIGIDDKSPMIHQMQRKMMELRLQKCDHSLDQTQLKLNAVRKIYNFIGALLHLGIYPYGLIK